MSARQNDIFDPMDEEDMDKFLDKIKYEYKDGWTEENWEEEMEKHPFFMTKPVDENATDLPPAIEAIRQLKWDEDDTPQVKALRYKDEGNLMFKAQKYKAALRSYQEALKEKFEDDDLHSILYSNIAAAEFHLKNHRTAFKNCILSRKYKPDNVKAIIKGAECCFELKLYDTGIKWCDAGLLKKFDCEKRKKEALVRKRSEEERKILDLIKKKNIKYQEDDESFNLFDKSCNPQGKIVSVADDSVSLIWPVVFLYPEHGQTDFIEAFHESITFEEHLEVMFNESAPWDSEKKYNTKSLRIYYENRRKGCLTQIKKKTTLLEALQMDGYIIQCGTPSFLIMVANSNFEKIYLEKFSAI